MVAIVIQTLTSENTGIVLEDGKVKELLINRPGNTYQVGNIYVGKVTKVEKGLQAAFVEIGDERLGFLQRKELPKARENTKLGIEGIITEGQSLIVQIQKSAYGNKGARLTANITIPGTDLVYLPFGNYVACSKKLDDERRTELKSLVDEIRLGEEGAIIRTSAKGKAPQVLEEEYNNLRQRWKSMEKRALKQSAPSSIYVDDTISDRLVRRFPPTELEAIYVDTSLVANRIHSNYPELNDVIFLEKNVESKLPKPISQIMMDAVSPRVHAAKGVALHIDQTEALTAIDVNSASFMGKGNKEQTVVQANCYAAVAVAQQVRLRNLSGIIIIDFIGMKTQSQKQQVLQALKQELAKDSVRTEVYGFTQLGLVEMTRKREAPSVGEILAGDQKEGHPKLSSETFAFLLERELIGYYNSEIEALLIEVNPAVLDAFTHLVQVEKLRNYVSQEVYILKSSSVATYHIKLAGSKQLIVDQLSTISSDSIDKIL